MAPDYPNVQVPGKKLNVSPEAAWPRRSEHRDHALDLGEPGVEGEHVLGRVAGDLEAVAGVFAAPAGHQLVGAVGERRGQPVLDGRPQVREDLVLGDGDDGEVVFAGKLCGSALSSSSARMRASSLTVGCASPPV